MGSNSQGTTYGAVQVMPITEALVVAALFTIWLTFSEHIL